MSKSLYKEEKIVATKTGIKLKFIPPSIPQYAFLIDFLVDGMKELLFTKEELASLKRDEVTNKVMEAFAGVAARMEDSAEQQKLMSMFFMQGKSVDIISKLIRECFPEVVPEKLTTNAYIELAELLLNQLENFQ